MPENYLPTQPHNASSWGKWLLAAGLLLVAVQGFFQLYAVQAIIFPGRYHEARLHLMGPECAKIASGLQALQGELNLLKGFCPPPGPVHPGPSDQSATGAASAPASAEPRRLPPNWRHTLQAAKQKRVSVAQKLNYLNTILISMQRSLESNHAMGSNHRPEAEKSLSLIHALLVRCRTYDIDLKNLSDKLEKIEIYCETPQSNQ